MRRDRVDKAAKSPSATTVNYTTSASADPHNGTPIVMLIHDLHIRIIHAATGEIIRQLTFDPQRRCHGTGKPIGGPSRPYGPRKTKQPKP